MNDEVLDDVRGREMDRKKMVANSREMWEDKRAVRYKEKER